MNHTKLLQSALDALRGYRQEHGDAQPCDTERAIEAALAEQQAAEPVEISPDFTDTARAALLWVLWHHQGGSSPVGQPIRYALGMCSHDDMSDAQIREAKRWDSLRPKPTHGITGSET